MTVKNYVLDINKTSLQHPSIVLRQDDYNIYTINISVTENGVPVNLGSYTLNFLGITPAGAKIIDSENFITTPADLAVGKFSYRFPKEAAGSKGVYDVAYFRLKTSSGATSTIDLNLRVLGGIDLTADEVKDYITVDDILLNTLTAEVFKKVDAKVDDHLATVKKGDTGATGPKGDKGDTPDLSNYVTVTDLNNGLSTKVTDNKNGTISVNGTSIIPANDKVIGRIDGAYKDMNDVPMGWMYLNGWADLSKLANWGLPNDFYYVHCFKADQFVSTTIQIAYGLRNYVYIRTKNNSNWSTWKLLADDSNVAHNTGNETIAGDKTFTGNTTVNNLVNTGSVATPYYVEQTPTTFNFTTSGSVRFLRIGNMVTVFYRAIPTTDNNVTLFENLPVRYRPVGESVQDNSSNGIITITAYGKIITETAYKTGGYFAISYVTSSPIA